MLLRCRKRRSAVSLTLALEAKKMLRVCTRSPLRRLSSYTIKGSINSRKGFRSGERARSLNTDSRSTESLPQLLLAHRPLDTLRTDSFAVQLEAYRSKHLHRPSRLLATQALVWDHNLRQHEFSVQLRAFDTSKSGAYLGLPALLALYRTLLEKSLWSGLIAVVGLNLRGGIRLGLQRRECGGTDGREGHQHGYWSPSPPQAAQRALRRDGHLQ